MCLPDLTACGTRCVDVAVDAMNCGSCGLTCPHAVGCIDGMCGRAVGPLTFDTPTQISGGSPQTQCLGGNEGYPERSLPGGDAVLFLGYNPQADGTNANWASAYNTWGAGLTAPAGPGYVIRGDPWASSSGSTGLNYISTLLNPPTNPNQISVGIAATTPSNMDNNVWSYAASPLNPLVIDADGPAIHFDPGSNVLWVANVRSGGTYWLNILKPCNAGAPGSSQCPVHVTRSVATSIWGHPNVIVNPCTHHAIAAYYDSIFDVRIRFYDSNGNRVGIDFRVADQSGTPQNNDNCYGAMCTGGRVCKCTGVSSTDCGGAGCMRVLDRVHLSVKYLSGVCRLALAYESSEVASDGFYYEKAHFAIVDVTNEAAPALIATGNSSLPQYARNEFEPTVSFNQYTNGFGFFYYQQLNGNPCTTVFRGATNTTLGGGTRYSVGPFTSAFPVIRFQTAAGLGDYVGIIRTGLPGGYLFPSWAEPVATSAVCRTCQGVSYSNRVMGVRVTP